MGSKTAECSRGEEMMTRRWLLRRAIPRMARLVDSVPPEVKTISLGWAAMKEAISSRASSTAARTSCPKRWTLEGLAQSVSWARRISAMTAGEGRVVALESR